MRATLLAANEGFRETMGEYAGALLFPYGNAEVLVERLRWLLDLPCNEREWIGVYLRERTVSLHGLDRLAKKILAVLADLKTSRTGNYEVKTQ